MTRARVCLILLVCVGAVQAGETAGNSSAPDAALLEFLADWGDEDQAWLDAQMINEQSDELSGDQDSTATTAQETAHE